MEFTVLLANHDNNTFQWYGNMDRQQKDQLEIADPEKLHAFICRDCCTNPTRRRLTPAFPRRTTRLKQLKPNVIELLIVFYTSCTVCVKLKEIPTSMYKVYTL